MDYDLFEREQRILDTATDRLAEMRESTSPNLTDFSVLVKEYRRILKQLRRVTKSSDKATYVSLSAKERAEAAAEARASFLASMSHEIRTPMNGVIGLTDLALDDETLNDKQRGYLVKIKRSADGLLAIINDILDISKIDAGALTLEYIPFDLHTVFSECQTIITHKAEEKGLALQFYNEVVLEHKIIGDPTRLRQVLLNFLANAVKFTKEGTVSLTAKQAETDGDSVLVDFMVADMGIGMTPEQCERIFDPFKQADDSTTRNFGGTGLGLSITKTIVEMMGGEIQLDSVAGIGSKFSFSLIFERSDEKSAPPEDYFPTGLNTDRPTFAGRVLLCDDNETNQLVAKENLMKLGFSVVVAGNGKIALEKIAAEDPFEIIFMDMHMPVMNGMQATRELIASGIRTPVIAMTANAMKEAREECLSAGMADYIAKPFKPRELWECLLKYLKPLEAAAVTLDNIAETAETVKDMPIDEAVGLSYAGDDENLYHKLLLRFLKEQPGMLATLERAIADRDFPLAYGIAHQMKGVSATLGATRLEELLGVVENAYAQATPDRLADEILDSCKAELSKVLSMISSMDLKDEEADWLNGLWEKGKAITLIGEIKPLLEMYISLNSDQLETVKKTLGPLGEPCKTLVAYLQDYDLESALITLHEMEMAIAELQ